MRMSCNGCRVLRKGCNDNCTLRPCLQWIKNPDFQANATVFLAKFYGRAGLINLINAGPEHLRPAIFRSLLYEACGRIVNPIYGSAGLLWSGSWQLCQTAVEAVLSGAPIMQISAESAVSSMSPPLKAGDIRHVSKVERENSAGSSHELHKVKSSRGRFKRSSGKPRAKVESAAEFEESAGIMLGELSHASRVSHPGSRESGEADSISVETVEASLAKPTRDGSDVELELTLTLGFEPIPKVQKACALVAGKKEMAGSDDDTCKVELALEYSG